MRATTNEASRTSSGYRTVPRLDIPCSSYLAVQLLSTPLFIDLDILVSQSLVMFVMFICLLSIVYLSMAFDQLELISGGQAGAVRVSQEHWLPHSPSCSV